MRHAETVTFGGSGLDRAAELRGDIAPVLSDPTARCILLWRGKPMRARTDGPLARLPLDHPVLQDASEMRLFLGRDTEGPVFAADVSRWTPPEGEGIEAGFVDQSEQRHPATGEAVFVELRAMMTQLSPRDAELAATAKAVLGWHRSHRFCSACGAQSAAEEAGWRRACPDCGTLHFPRTDPVVIMLVTHGEDVLLGRSPGWPEGMYSLLAGFVEPGETLEAAVRREVTEETGVTTGAVSYLASQPWAFPSSLMFGCLAEATSREITLDPVEIEDAFWVPRSEVAQAMRGEHPRIKKPRSGAIAHFLLENWLADTLA